MKTGKLNAQAHGHIALFALAARLHRVMKVWQIWHIDYRYRTYGKELDYCDEALIEIDWYRAEINKIRAEAKNRRAALLIRRSNVRLSLLKLGGR